MEQELEQEQEREQEREREQEQELERERELEWERERERERELERVMIIFVGDKPSKRMKPGAKPFEGAACEKRLKNWLRDLQLKDHYKIYNRNDFGLLWHIVNHYYMLGNYKFIALGNKAARFLKEEIGSTGDCNGNQHDFFKLPHPSGRNRQINDKEFIAKKLNECKEWLNK